jgi:L-ascorbate metabolism protein UlaG (beta-lactamase superfamily)
VPDSLTYVGHATVLLELGGVRLLTDPVLRDRLMHLRRHGPSPPPVAPVDAVLISHLHRDHFDRPSLRHLAGPPAAIVPAGAGRLMRRLGYGSVTELASGGSTRVGGLEVTAVPARHDGRRDPVLGATAEAVGFVVGDRRRVYFAGDTDLFDEMALLAGRVDVALLPIWGWGPRLPKGHLNPETAARATALIRPAIAVPIHWGTMRSLGARANRDGRAPALAFAKAVASLTPATEVRVLAPGESMQLGG